MTHLLTADYKGRIFTYCGDEGPSDSLLPVDWYYVWDFEENRPDIISPRPDICPRCIKEWLESFE